MSDEQQDSHPISRGVPRRPRGRSLITAALAVAVLPAAAACSAGFAAETQQIQNDGVAATTGPMRVQNISVVQSGLRAALTAAVINTSASTSDTLQSISLQNGPDAVISGAGPTPTPGGASPAAVPGPVAIPAQSAVYFGATGSGLSSPATASFPSLPPDTRLGSLVTITFTFANAGTVTAQAPVVSHVNAIYSGVTPAGPSAPTPPPASPAATPTGTSTPADTATGTSTPTGTGTPTGTATASGAGASPSAT